MTSTTSLTGLLARVTRLYRMTLNATLTEKGFDLSSEMCGILVELWENDNRSPQDLAQTVKKDKAGISRLLRSLHQRKLISVVQDETDLRRKKIRLTQKGLALQTNLKPVLLSVRQQTLADISVTEIEQSKAVLLQIISNLEA